MKAVYKWRLENGVYGYITNEQNESAFIYDQTTFEREYPDGTVISGTYVDEPLIANIVSKKSKSEYIQMFNEFKEFVNVEYPYVAFLDVMYYYNVENDECSTSAGSLKCAGSDVLFRVKSVISGLEPEVTIEPINSNPENGDLTYDMSFVLPISMVSGGTTSFSALTSNTITVLSSITAEEFVRNNGTEEQYLMADGSITVLNAGTNVTIATATTTDGKTVTISSEDTNTWRNINVNDSQILDNSTNSGLTLSAGTNVTLTTSNNGSYKVVTIKATDTWRKISVNDGEFLGVNNISGLTLSAGTNVTLTTGTTNGSKVIFINSTASGGKIYQNGRNITIDGDDKINAEGYYFDSGLANVTLFDKSFTGLKVSSTYENSGVTTNINPIGVVDIGDIVLVNNVQYIVTNVSAGPPSIIFDRRFQGAINGTKIYKINQTGTTDRKNAATAKRTFAAGTGTVAYKKSMTVVGEYNDLENNSNKSDILFAVGNGTNAERSNAFIVRKDGSIHIHSTEDPVSGEHYGGRIDFGDGQETKTNTYIEESIDDRLLFNADDFLFNCGYNSVYINDNGVVSATVNEVPNVKLGVPIGTVVMWPGSTAPTGWLLCTGDSIAVTEGSSSDYDFQFSRSDVVEGPYFKATDEKYRTLLKIIGSTYGMVLELDQESALYHATGAYLPDLQQRFPLGAKEDNSWKCGNQTYNTNLGYTDGEKEHKLAASEVNHTHALYDSYSGSGGGAYGTVTNEHKEITMVNSTSLAHNNVPPYLAINFIIKYA